MNLESATIPTVLVAKVDLADTRVNDFEPSAGLRKRIALWCSHRPGKNRPAISDHQSQVVRLQLNRNIDRVTGFVIVGMPDAVVYNLCHCAAEPERRQLPEFRFFKYRVQRIEQQLNFPWVAGQVERTALCHAARH